MIPGPIISQQMDGEKMETVADFIFFSSKITVDGDYSRACSLEEMVRQI